MSTPFDLRPKRGLSLNGLILKVLSTRLRREHLGGIALIALVSYVLPHSSGAISAKVTAAAAIDPNAVFEARSPGSRPHGALFQTKADRVAASGHSPSPPPATRQQRVLSTIRDRPMVISVNDLMPEIPLLDPAALDPLTRLAFAPDFFPLVASPMAEPFGSVRDPTVTGPVNAVPEPNAWLMLIGGHAVLGWVLRERRRSLPGFISDAGMP